jgi:3-oxoacyl-[acyl-carrier-protein] synthase III
MCPIDDWADNIKYLDDVSLHGQGGRIFVSYGKELTKAGTATVLSLMDECPVPLSSLDWVFPHTHSKRFWEDIAQARNTTLPFYFIFPKYGNLVSGSTPAAIALAMQAGALQRGQRVAGWIAAAGMSFGLHTFTF